VNSLNSVYAERYMKPENTDSLATIPEELYDAARAHISNGDYADAAEVFSNEHAHDEIRKRKLKNFGRDPVAHRILGAVKGYLHDFHGAREDLFHAAILCQRELSAVYVNISGTYLDENNSEESIRYAKMALEAYPGWSMPDINLACGYVLMGDKEAAVSTLLKVTEHFPGAMDDPYFCDRILSDAFLSVLNGIHEYDDLVDRVKSNQGDCND
jgi:tetratricopeptide (TPR) repeat protein